MSRLSIFDSGWIDIVFEGRNQEYGAYQLRKQNPKTMLKALLLAMVFTIALLFIPIIAGKFKSSNIHAPEILAGTTIELGKIVNPEPKPPVKNDLTPPLSPLEEPTTEKTFRNAEVVKPAEAAEPGEISAPVSTDDRGITGGSAAGSSDSGNSGIASGSGIGPDNLPELPTGPVGLEILDRKPVYPGGNESFRNEIAKRFKTPDDEFEPGTLVIVELTFVIETDGSMSNIRVVRSSGKSIDEEALRVLRSMKKKWEPGYYKGKAVSVIFRQAIKLRVQ
jgi:protein TonB